MQGFIEWNKSEQQTNNLKKKEKKREKAKSKNREMENATIQKYKIIKI